jgi:N-acetylgalactosamine-N,N'-diacetylbacillosaminyl-diphospho-undecaprenol 4-alpha-N-acetylgalactosaminyltransferase
VIVTRADQPIASSRSSGGDGAVNSRPLPRVLFVINSLSGGGAERVFATLIANSDYYRSQFDIRVVLLDDERAAYALPDWVPLIQLNSGGSLLRSMVGLIRVARHCRPQAICAFLTRANMAAIFAARAAGCAAIISERVNTSAHLRPGRFGAVSKALVRLTYPRAARVLAVSQGVADTLAGDFGVDRRRLQVVHNPVDVASITARTREEPAVEVRSDDVVVLGRLMPNKNFALAFRAFARLPGERRLLVLGAGPLREALQGLAEALGIANRVIFTGFVDNPHAILARAGVFVLSSNAEGFPNALVEAMASGIPAVATDCPSGPAEILQVDSPPCDGAWVEGSGGLLIPVDDVDAMERAILEASSAQRREQFVADAERRLADFRMEAFVAAFWQAIGSTAPARAGT